ncbi:MAG: isoleucine--tRNA ligase [Candidatus Woesearchaeota archaeon]
MAINTYEPTKIEPEVMKFWEREQVYEKAKKKNAGKKKYYFLDGPPYTSGHVHIGTAWNKALKDMVLRYKRMRGLDVWDRAGYDMHGLPTENQIRKKHKLFLKKDIEAFGLEKYNKECEQFAVEMMHHMNKDFERLGVWMDFDNAYIPISKEFIEGEWMLIKKAHEQGRLYEGLRTMPWCAHCETNLAKHELEYENVKENSIFVKFRIKDKPNEFLVIWTTTPWTIPFNLAVMVNPDLDYVRVQVKNEVWIIAKALANAIVQGIAGEFPRILEEFKGNRLEGVEYLHPFEDAISEYKRIKSESPKTHTVVLSSEYVDASAGSGLVHCAPGCGPEDYEVGHRNKIPAWNNIDEHGRFPLGMGEFSNLIAKKDDKKFVEALKKRCALIAEAPVEHEYAHCQRCHNPVIYRTTKQWFFRVEDLKPKMLEYHKNSKWVPEAAWNAFDSWLRNLRDNSITKQNYWGTPMPIWKCASCGDYDVISTVAELEEKSRKKIVELHRPWIDRHEMPCKCGGKKQRIPDILDVWVDAGTVSWNCLDYPHRKDLFEQLFPAEFILEGKDQVRGWFNLLMVAGVLALGRQSYKNVYMHGFVQDALGRKMSKSLGNYIEPKEVIDKYGADTFRFYAIGGANPAIDLNYNHEDAKLKYKNLIILWNIHNYLIDLARTIGKNPADLDPKVMETLFSLEEHYIVSKLHSTINAVTERMEGYLINEVPALVEELFLELSRTYVQLVREKAAVGSDNDKEVVLFTLYHVLLETMKLFAIVAPFITEQMYQNIRKEFKLPEESIHLFQWPVADKKKVNKELELAMQTAGRVIEASLAAREKARLSLRWPVKGIFVVSANDELLKQVRMLESVIKTQTNAKEIISGKEFAQVKELVKANHGAIGKTFGHRAPQVIAKIAQESDQSIIKALAKDKKVTLNLGNEKVELGAEHFIIERQVPKHIVAVEGKEFVVYLDTTRNLQLEAEGYAREIMRRVQALRKEAGLDKRDQIVCLLEMDKDFIKMLEPWLDAIKEKVGARTLKLSDQPPARKHAHSSSEKVREKKFSVHFDKA